MKPVKIRFKKKNLHQTNGKDYRKKPVIFICGLF